MSNEQLIKKINDGEHERHQSCSLLHSRKRQTLDLRIFHQRGDSSRQAQSFLIAPRASRTGSSSNSVVKVQSPFKSLAQPSGFVSCPLWGNQRTQYITSCTACKGGLHKNFSGRPFFFGRPNLPKSLIFYANLQLHSVVGMPIDSLEAFPIQFSTPIGRLKMAKIHGRVCAR